MKALTLIPVLSALAIGSQAQTQPPTPAPAPLSVLSCNWTRANRSQGSAVDEQKKGKDAAIDQQIALANREADDAGKSVSGESLVLAQRKQEQVALIPLPAGVVKGYLYKAQVRNVADKTIKRIQWSYVFTDVLTQKELARHEFYSRVQIHPGRKKKLSVFTRGSPPGVINAKELSRNASKPWGESVVIKSVEFADGSLWKLVPKAEQPNSSNHQ